MFHKTQCKLQAVFESAELKKIKCQKCVICVCNRDLQVQKELQEREETW